MSAADVKLDIRDLEAAITPRTRALILNTPHNPTGKVPSVASSKACAWQSAHCVCSRTTVVLA